MRTLAQVCFWIAALPVAVSLWMPIAWIMLGPFSLLLLTPVVWYVLFERNRTVDPDRLLLELEMLRNAIAGLKDSGATAPPVLR